MDLLLLATFIVAFLSSIISGMAGGGGGFVMTPFFLMIGLSPQQIVANASIASLGLGGSSLVAMRGKQLLHRRFLVPLALLTVAFTVAAMFVLPSVKSGAFETTIGVLLIVLSPTLFIKKSGLQPGKRSQKSIIFGYAAYAAILFANALGGGLATLLFLPLIFLLGLSALQANMLRRVLMLIQAAVTFLFVVGQGYILWQFALVSLVGCYLGGFVGTKIAIRQGEKFVKAALGLLMIVSGIALLIR